MPKGVFPRRVVPPEVRFWARVVRRGPDDCWEWPNVSDGHYGSFWTGTKQDGAHRYSLELKLGRPLADGEFALHTCDNKRCVNPNHLFPGTSLDNSRDMVAKGRKERGAAVYGAKATDKKVLFVRKFHAAGDSAAEVADMFDLSVEVVYHILHGKTWKHVGGPVVGAMKKGPAKGTHNNVGESNPKAILNDRLVRAIKRMGEEDLAYGRVTRIVDAIRSMGVPVGPRTVSDILHGVSWKHVK